MLRTISFHLDKPYGPFIDNLVIGILPKHIWKNTTVEEFSFSQFNNLPIGSGPYRVERVERNSGGIPNYYQLGPFVESINGAPYIENLSFKFFSSEQTLLEAYERGDISSFGGISPEKAQSLEPTKRILSAPLPRIFAVFFNQNKSKVLLDKAVRQALDLASPRERIVAEVLHGYGTIIDGPLPVEPSNSDENVNSLSIDEKIEMARDILSKGGWNLNSETGKFEKKSGSDIMELSFSISTGDVPELRQSAEILKESWERLGASVSVLIFESGDLNHNVIRPRQFEALLFGEVIGRDRDVYPFWHSSQRNDPGLNIALYTNAQVDRVLEEARSSSDPEKVEKNYAIFASELKKDLPAVFLYSPSYIYVLPKKIKNASLGRLATSQDRFRGVRDWYIHTDKIWKIFTD
jgi:peptide/nickel transport system substrate-binding protein